MTRPSFRGRRRQNAKNKRLEVRIDRRPLFYGGAKERTVRLRFILRVYGLLIPTVFLAIMFGRSKSTLLERLRKLHPGLSKSDRRRCFQEWLRRDKSSELPYLTPQEQTYLSDLRAETLALYAAPYEPTACAKRLKSRLMRLARRVPASVPRHPCSNAACSNSFPATGDFFPNLKRGGKSPGRCSVCCYLRHRSGQKRLREKGPSRPLRRLAVPERERFWAVEEALNRELPTRVLAEMFNISSTTVNTLRKHPLPRLEAKGIFHRFQTTETPPRYPFLDERENESVAASWAKIRSERSRKEFDSADEHQAFLAEFTRQHPDLPRKQCRGCKNTFAADNFCFPEKKLKRRGRTVSSSYCRSCYR